MLLLLIVQIGVIFAGPSPLYRWPLNDLTCGKEVQTTNDDAIQPKQADCVINKPGPVEVGSTYIWSDGFVEFSPSQSHIDVEIKNDVPILSFGFTILINPTENIGTIVHYKATAPISGELVEFRIQFVAGKLSMVLSDGTNMYNKTFNTVMQTNVFSLVGFGFLYSDRTANFFIKNSNSRKSISYYGRGLTVPGILRFGASQTTTPTDMFNGKIACALFFNNYINSYDEQNMENACIQDWIGVSSPVPSSVTPTQPTQPNLIWPLDSINTGKENTTGRIPFNQPDFRFAYGPPDLPNEAVLFDGSRLTSIHFDGIPSYLLANHHSFGMYLYVDDLNYVTFMTIKSDAEDVAETRISVDGTSVEIKLFNNIGSECGHLVRTNALQLNTWSVLGFKITFPSDMTLLVNDSEYIGSHSCGLQQASSSNYSILLGYSEEENEGFHGRIRCLVLVDDIEQMTEVLNVACNDKVYISENELIIPRERERYSIISKTNSKPLSSLPATGFISQSTLSNCGLRCLEERYCRSFTFQAMGECTLYDFVVFKTLTSISGTNYYVVT
ncbi:hypothetical protein LOTGIDRAFT_166120 [Lottia gigantea]|uniref:Apple domain-containing protein n=1 Tax=Lottia gigantea TaxID=225164 RepID=V3ZA19_LOTGI|nr:hypothetical protein LOTGIDRAFT_166120 [Lottia gigantea]ESO87823.1 hypothetical protein LOTGIDRAFT_166120 [Lottia gigantea]